MKVRYVLFGVEFLISFKPDFRYDFNPKKKRKDFEKMGPNTSDF
jgi:hypothetical protein